MKPATVAGQLGDGLAFGMEQGNPGEFLFAVVRVGAQLS